MKDWHDDSELLTDAVSEFARTMARSTDIGDVLNDLAERITAALGVAGTGVSILESGKFRFVAASDERCAGLERVQEKDQAGPCLGVWLTGKAVTVADLPGTSHGWAAYQQAAQDAGILAVASVPMQNDGEIIGSVSLYREVRRPWSATELRAAAVLADMATGYLVQACELDRQCRVNEELRAAMHSRIVIEQAKGVLAVERSVSVDEAFEVLRTHAHEHSVSVHSIAEAVVRLGLRPC